MRLCVVSGDSRRKGRRRAGRRWPSWSEAEQSGAEPSAAELLATGSRREAGSGGKGWLVAWAQMGMPRPHFSLPSLASRAYASLSVLASTPLLQEAFQMAPLWTLVSHFPH